MLVRRHGVAGKDGNANQCVVVGDNRRGRGSQPRGDGANRTRMRSVSAVTKHMSMCNCTTREAPDATRSGQIGSEDNFRVADDPGVDISSRNSKGLRR